MIKFVHGDILDAEESLIFQQVNCHGVMGAGLAKAICIKWPSVKEKYIRYCAGKSPQDLLGKYMTVKVDDNKWVVNIFGQMNYGRQNVCYTNYVALNNAFHEIASKTNRAIAIPYGFGCGLARGDWNIVLNIIKSQFSKQNITIYKNF